MTQTTFPEIQAATEALEKRLPLTEAEIVQLKEDLKAKKALVKSWKKALAAFTPRQGPPKKKFNCDKGSRSLTKPDKREDGESCDHQNEFAMSPPPRPTKMPELPRRTASATRAPLT